MVPATGTAAPAVELASLRLDAVSPGPVRPELWPGVPQDAPEGLFRSSAGSLPVGRVGEPADVADVCV